MSIKLDKQIILEELKLISSIEKTIIDTLKDFKISSFSDRKKFR